MLIGRRELSGGLIASIAATKLSLSPTPAQAKRSYKGPNVIIVRFGGGVRRRETIVSKTTYAPFLLNVLTKRGVLIPDLRISQLDGVDTSHAEGTLNLLTGRYLSYRLVESRFLSGNLEPTQPTLFEYFRKAFDVPAHRALLINGEDRPQEEFFSFGVHGHFGVDYRAQVLSLHRFKLYWLKRKIERSAGTDKEIIAAKKQLAELRAKTPRDHTLLETPELSKFWERWRRYFGESGFVNPRGDRLLTELALRALNELQPQLMMINYQDPDYVHWGNASHYTRAISVIDEGLKQLATAVDAHPLMRNNTIFVIVPDCGRDANPLMGVPFQHHFNSRSAHEIWALIFGPGIGRNKTLDKPVDQIRIAATVGGLMGLRTPQAEASAIEVIWS
ncbi:MAG: hypothetical protein ACR2OW_05790 [Methyloligellaceae bacterium]